MRFVILALLLCGCATSREVVGPDGDKVHIITCSGAANTWGNCYEKAGELCPNGYHQRGAVANPTGATVVGGTVLMGINRQMAISCK